MTFRTRPSRSLALVLALLAGAPQACAQEFPKGHERLGITGRKAPAWTDVSWSRAAGLPADLDVSHFRGRVLYLYAFQAWCPGCKSDGFPTLEAVREQYRDADDVAFVAVQTVFEGFDSNTAERGLALVDSFELSGVPVGQSGRTDVPSAFMADYRTGGTPWTVIVDKRGVVRFNDFHISLDEAARVIDTLREEDALGPVVGRGLPALSFDRWVRPRAPSKDRKPRAVLYRWWTIGCPYCRASLPALDALADRYRTHGLDVVGVYHPKPPRAAAAVNDADVIAWADARSFAGPIALDTDWSELRRAWLEREPSAAATSVSILVDAAGVVRHVHPGPVLFPSDDPEHARESADYEALEAAVRDVLGVEADSGG